MKPPAPKKAFPLRIEPSLWAALERARTLDPHHRSEAHRVEHALRLTDEVLKLLRGAGLDHCRIFPVNRSVWAG